MKYIQMTKHSMIDLNKLLDRAPFTSRNQSQPDYLDQSPTERNILYFRYKIPCSFLNPVIVCPFISCGEQDFSFNTVFQYACISCWLRPLSVKTRQLFVQFENAEQRKNKYFKGLKLNNIYIYIYYQFLFNEIYFQSSLFSLGTTL